MTRRLSFGVVVAICAFVTALVSPAHAGNVTVVTGTTSFSAGADVVTNFASFTNVNVPSNGSTTAGFQIGDLFIGDSGLLNQNFPFTLTESFTANGVPGTVTLVGSLLITPPGDSLFYISGTPTSVFLPSGEKFTITTLPFTLGPSFNFGDNFYLLTADYSLQTVPEPGVVAFGILAGGSVLGLIARKRKA